MNFLFPLILMLAVTGACRSAVIEFNNLGGTTATNGIHVYIEDTTKIQVRRLNNTGQVYSPSVVPPSANLDNGIFIRANGLVYGPSHSVTTFNPTGGMYSTSSISATSPPNPSSSGIQQTATANFGITSGPQVAIVWRYTTPLDFLTAEVTLTIPAGYAVTAANPVRYYHAFDTFLGGSDNGCGVTFVDASGKRVVGTYPPASGTTCPSSTSIPTGVAVVESFRERSGQAFNEYCAAGWASFFTNGAPNCSVLQAAVMSNTVTTAYQDTGIGIEFDFTTPGTYTFSYDFVVGSPNVPPYDHLEIRHDGAATLCPENIIVLACTSSTVPCPLANQVSSGTLTGAVTTTPSVPSVSVTPATFTLGGSASTATVALQGSSAGVYTLGSSGLSSIPLNGTKCWNTASLSQSCVFTITATPCVSNYECMETSQATYNNLTVSPASRNPLYTKLAGTNFKFDVVALQTGGVQSTSYAAASGVTVELFDDSVPAATCSAYASPVASQAITFVAGDLGRKTLASNFNLARAYGKLRCRVTDTNLTPTVYGCSSDDFSVRPTGLVVSSSANADSTGTSATTAAPIKTGATFTMSAAAVNSSAAGVLGYNTAPKLSTTAGMVMAHTGSVQAGTVTGTFGSAAAATGIATGNFAYSEVGYFRYNTSGVYDDTFTVIDQAADCTNDFSNLAPTSGVDVGKYGCKFGNTTTTNYFGRFVPDHFAVTAAAPVAACTVHPAASGSYTPADFTYFGLDGFTTPFTLRAQNSGNTTTQNYTGAFARLALGTWTNFGFTAASLPAGATLAASAQAPAGTWTNGVAAVTAKHTVGRPTALGGPTNVIVSALPVDLDGVTMTAASAVANAATSLRYGRLRVTNAIGPHTRPLRMPVEAQYWNGSLFTRNVDDSCTAVQASAWSFGNYIKRPASAVFNPVGADVPLVGGSGFLTVPIPTGGRVTFDASINLAVTGAETAASSCLKNLALGTPTRPWAPTVTNAAPSPVRAGLNHLLGQWCDTTYVNNPSARGSFGLYRGADATIFLRENY